MLLKSSLLKKLSGIIGILFIMVANTYAQKINGIIYDLESSEPISNVSIQNMKSAVKSFSDKDGKFSIDAAMGERLSLFVNGYTPDTIFLYQEGVQRVYMMRDGKSIVLNEALVTRLTDSRLDEEIKKAKEQGQIANASQYQGGIRVSPSRLFGKKGKTARKNLDILVLEKNNRIIDRRFSDKLIASLTPLEADEIPLFREQFRPSLDFIQTVNDETLKLYVLDSYKKYKSNKK
ncbi:hypothetical protein ACR79M_03615 [Sphingobacterium spiritivorum]|uniref:hypothetical protein n=1 Tax=Sphingobacterium TaxID=28453 RepID=UPI0025E09EA3|nr:MULTISPECIES: hypothetical protein [unclassified Sphingobacterium]